jgi:hypothetical protein
MALEAIEAAQAKLRHSRGELLGLLDGKEGADAPHFPRSATMRFLANSGAAQAVLMGVAPRLFKLLRFAPLARSLFSRR